MQQLPPAIRLALVVAFATLLSCGESDSPTTPIGGNDTIPINPIDTIAPSKISPIEIVYDDLMDEVRVEWAAPHDNAPPDPVDQYDIRYTYTRGDPPDDFWHRSIPVDSPPSPASPGTLQQYAFPNPDRGRDLYVGIRSFDEAGNVSPPSDVVGAHVDGYDFTGRCVDALTGLPVEGLEVRISGIYDVTTDANGEFSTDDLFPGNAHFDIQNGAAGTTYHRISQTLVMESDASYTFTMIPFQRPNASVFGDVSLLQLLMSLTFTEDPPHILAKYPVSPVPCYFPPYINSDGVDYAARAKDAAQRWMDATGRQIFTFVDSPPDTGIVAVYRSNADMDPLIAVAIPELGPDGHLIGHEIQIINDIEEENFYLKVMIHELGHTLPLDHIRHPGFIMYGGQPLPDEITVDEVNLAILLQSLPIRVDMSIYDLSNPPFGK